MRLRMGLWHLAGHRGFLSEWQLEFKLTAREDILCAFILAVSYCVEAHCASKSATSRKTQTLHQVAVCTEQSYLTCVRSSSECWDAPHSRKATLLLSRTRYIILTLARRDGVSPIHSEYQPSRLISFSM